MIKFGVRHNLFNWRHKILNFGCFSDSVIHQFYTLKDVNKPESSERYS